MIEEREIVYIERGRREREREREKREERERDKGRARRRRKTRVQKRFGDGIDERGSNAGLSAAACTPVVLSRQGRGRGTRAKATLTREEEKWRKDFLFSYSLLFKSIKLQ